MEEKKTLPEEKGFEEDMTAGEWTWEEDRICAGLYRPGMESSCTSRGEGRVTRGTVLIPMATSSYGWEKQGVRKTYT